jgi:hypothetical protein
MKLPSPSIPSMFSLNIILTDTVESYYYFSPIIEQSRSRRHNPDSLSFPRSSAFDGLYEFPDCIQKALRTLLWFSLPSSGIHLRFDFPAIAGVRTDHGVIEESRFDTRTLEASLISPKNCACHDTDTVGKEPGYSASDH